MIKKRYFGRGVLTVLAAFFAVAFLLPTVLTFTNSFMTQSEIAANYGKVVLQRLRETPTSPRR